MTWSSQFNAAGKTGIQIDDHKSNPSAHTKEEKGEGGGGGGRK